MRTELVLQTSDGPRRWTVRNHRLRSELHVGATVKLTVTALAGYVAKAEPLSG